MKKKALAIIKASGMFLKDCLDGFWKPIYLMVIVAPIVLLDILLQIIPGYVRARNFVGRFCVVMFQTIVFSFGPKA